MKRRSVSGKVLRRRLAYLLGGFAWALSGCGGGDHDHDGHAEAGHAHVHHAPHGGALGMIGEHLFQLEVLSNREEGRIELYVLDGEAERFVRIAATEIEGVAKVGDREWRLRFKAVANAATGEEIGSSSHFVAEAPDLVEEPEFELRFDRLELLGQVFSRVSIPFPEGSHGEAKSGEN